MSDTIVVGVDSSETAAKAAATAARLAAALGAELVLVTAFDDAAAPPPTDDPYLSRITAKDAAEAVAGDVAERLRSDFEDVVMTPRAEVGKPAAALVRAAEELGASMIVVGNKRVQSIGRVLGSVARDVAHHAPCDVYIAHTVER